MEINIGIGEQDCVVIVEGLLWLLVDIYIFYLKIYNFYWNVIGLMFNMLYLMFEGQYIELVVVVDDIVECIWVLGFLVFGIYVVYVCFLFIKEEEGVLEVEEMIW